MNRGPDEAPAREAVGRAFERAGVEGWLHAVDIDTGDDLGVGADQPVALASVFKLPLLVALYREADAGAVRLDRRIRLEPATRSPGMTGLSVMRDAVEMSLRDLALLMIAVSDNAAADAVLAEVGLDAVARALAGLGLSRTVVQASCRDTYDLLSDDLAREGRTLAQALADPGVLARLRVLDPASTNRSTPREMTSLLAAIWRGEAASPVACREMRSVLALQVWPHRLASGFPGDDVRVSGKTGTLAPLRSEVGVVEHPDGRRHAVAVFTRSSRSTISDPAADAVIGTAARLAVDHLRLRG